VWLQKRRVLVRRAQRARTDGVGPLKVQKLQDERGEAKRRPSRLKTAEQRDKKKRKATQENKQGAEKGKNQTEGAGNRKGKIRRDLIQV